MKQTNHMLECFSKLYILLVHHLSASYSVLHLYNVFEHANMSDSSRSARNFELSIPMMQSSHICWSCCIAQPVSLRVLHEGERGEKACSAYRNPSSLCSMLRLWPCDRKSLSLANFLRERDCEGRKKGSEKLGWIDNCPLWVIMSIALCSTLISSSADWATLWRMRVYVVCFDAPVLLYFLCHLIRTDKRIRPFQDTWRMSISYWF